MQTNKTQLKILVSAVTWIGLTPVGLVAQGSVQTPFRFIDTTTKRGIRAYTMAEGMGGGIAAADYDNDGYVDVFVPNGAGVPDQLYHNQGNGHFEEIAASAGLASTEKNRCALWLDYNADGKLDLLVANDVEDAASTYRLYRQVETGQFEDVTVEAGLFTEMSQRRDPPPSPRHRGGMCAGDINNDGYLDIYAAMWNGAPQLFLNNGNGTFSDITTASGVDDTDSEVEAAHWYAHQPMMADFNGDGWLDVFGAVDFLWNVLFINQGDNSFSDVAPQAGADNAMNDMGTTLGDYDNDGDLDIYITNIFELLTFNVLLRNDSVLPTLTFSETAEQAGVDFGGWGWGTTFMDANNDGWLDIGATNGWQSPNYVDDPSKFYLNRGGDPVTFEDVSAQVGFDDTNWGSSLIAFDFDRDGDLDLMQSCMNGPLRLLQNTLRDKKRTVDGSSAEYPGAFLVIRPRMVGHNRFSIGAIVRVRAGNLNMMRIITAGTSYLGQEPAEAFFGLGQARTVDLLTVEWPDGRVTTLKDVPASAILEVYDDGQAPSTLELGERIKRQPRAVAPAL